MTASPSRGGWILATPRARPASRTSPPPTSSPTSPSSASSTSSPPRPHRPLPPPLSPTSIVAMTSSARSAPPPRIPSWIRVLALILTSDFIKESNTKIAISALISDLHGSVYALVSVLKQGSSLESRIDAARVLQSILGLREAVQAKMVIAEKEEVIAELIRLIGPSDDKGTMDRRAVEAGLGCLAKIAEVRQSRSRIARLGVVPEVTRMLAAKAEVVPPPAVERAMKVMEVAAGCAKGRAAICEAAEESVGAVAGWMMKTRKEGAEAAVAVLWTICHYFQDSRAVELTRPGGWNEGAEGR